MLDVQRPKEQWFNNDRSVFLPPLTIQAAQASLVASWCQEPEFMSSYHPQFIAFLPCSQVVYPALTIPIFQPAWPGGGNHPFPYIFMISFLLLALVYSITAL